MSIFWDKLKDELTKKRMPLNPVGIAAEYAVPGFKKVFWDKPQELGKTIGLEAMKDVQAGKPTTIRKAVKTVAPTSLQTGMALGGVAAGGPLGFLKTYAGYEGTKTALKPISRAITPGQKIGGYRALSQDVIGTLEDVKSGKDIPKVGLYTATGVLTDKMGNALNLSKFTKTGTTGLFNVLEDELTSRVGLTEKPTGQSRAAGFLTPFLLGYGGDFARKAVDVPYKQLAKDLAQNESGAIRPKTPLVGPDDEIMELRKKLDKMTPAEVIDATETNYSRGGTLPVAEMEKFNKESVATLNKMLDESPVSKQTELERANKISRIAEIAKRSRQGLATVGEINEMKKLNDEVMKIKPSDAPDSAGRKALEVRARAGDKSAKEILRNIEDVRGEKLGPESGAFRPGADIERGFITTLKESPNTKSEVKDIIGGKYTPITNDATMKKASELVATDEVNARELVFDQKGKYDADTIATGQELIRKYQAEGKFQEAASVAEEIARKGTEAGQAIQSFSIWNRLTPEGMLAYAQKTLVKAGVGGGLTDQEMKEIYDHMKVAEGLPDGLEKNAEIKAALEVINNKIPIGAMEYIDAYRYQNMLSGPRTQLRNIYGNVFQTFITRPATMAVEAPIDWVRATLTGAERQRYIADVPTYYKTVFNAAPTGTEAFMQAWRGDINVSKPDISELRGTRMPKALSITTRFMEGMDRYFQAMIGAGEYAVQMKNGASETDARAAADEMAKYSLFRQKLYPEDQGVVLNKVDQFTDTIGNLPGRRWFVPFMQTPMNVAKQWIEYSPAGVATTIGADNKQEQIAKTMLGSIVTMVGAKLAMEGRTTWQAPSTSKEKSVYYATGRKPYSVKIGDKWVPMIYFGPFALSLALPAAYKYYTDDSKEALTASQFDKAKDVVMSAAKLLSNQTFLSGLNNYIQVLSGDEDITTPSSLGFTASQLIPASGLVRWVNTLIDPVFRKQKTFMDSVRQSVPFATKDNFPYLEPNGQPATREPINYALPYDIGISNPKYDPLLEFQTVQGQTSVLRNFSGRYKAILKDQTISPEEKQQKIDRLVEEYKRASERIYTKK